MAVEHIKNGIQAASGNITEGLTHVQQTDERIQQIGTTLASLMDTLSGISFAGIEKDLQFLSDESRSASTAFHAGADELAAIEDESRNESLALMGYAVDQGGKLTNWNTKVARDMRDDVHVRAARQLVALVNTTSMLINKLGNIQQNNNEAQIAGAQAIENGAQYNNKL